MQSGSNWSTQQLTEFLASVSSFTNEEAAEQGAVERIAEVLEAEVAILIRSDSIVTSVGFPVGGVPEKAILAVMRGEVETLDVPGAGCLPVVIMTTEDEEPIKILVARSRDDRFTGEELDLLRGMGRVLSLTLELLRALAETRRSAVAAERAKANAIKGAILESALDCVITADHRGRIVDFNPAAERTFGYRREDVVGRTLAETIIPPSYRGAHKAGFEKYLRTGRSTVLDQRVELVAMRADGSEFPTELAITAIEDGDKPLFAAYLRDITERKRSEEETGRSMSLLQATLESTADGILVVDREGHMVDFNQKFLDMWRIPEDVAAARDDDQVLAFILDQTQDPDAFLARVRELYDSDEDGFDEVVFKDGRVFERYSKPQLVRNEKVGRVWSFRDLTDQRKLEGELRWSQKMEAVGQLAGGIAHDFNNLLAVIINYATFLQEDIDPGDDRHADVGGILGAAERGATLVRQLLVFSRKEIVNPEVLDLNEIVREMETLLGRTIGENVGLVLALAEETWAIKADQGQLEQILMNLAVNARDAMPSGGELAITTENVEAAEDHLDLAPHMEPGPYVRLTVRDSGTGMTEDVKARIFEPFFTTKGRGKGTGLGLATVYAIVKRLRGYIRTDSASGKGTAFDIYLPRTTDRPRVAETAREEHVHRASGETIVVVEDEVGVRDTVTRILTRAGYTVLAAASGEEALELIENQGDDVDLVLTDVIMAGISGKLMTERLLDRGHRFRTLYMSGYADDIVAREGVLAEGEELIQKPFAAEDLLLRIGRVLEAAPVLTP
jgi:PAS domain S-box-containing protein